MYANEFLTGYFNDLYCVPTIEEPVVGRPGPEVDTRQRRADGKADTRQRAVAAGTRPRGTPDGAQRPDAVGILTAQRAQITIEMESLKEHNELTVVIVREVAHCTMCDRNTVLSALAM